MNPYSSQETSGEEISLIEFGAMPVARTTIGGTSCGVNSMVTGDTKATFDNVTQSTALHNLRQIEGMLEGNRGADTETRAHRENVLYTIRRGLHDEK